MVIEINYKILTGETGTVLMVLNCARQHGPSSGGVPHLSCRPPGGRRYLFDAEKLPKAKFITKIRGFNEGLTKKSPIARIQRVAPSSGLDPRAGSLPWPEG